MLTPDQIAIILAATTVLSAGIVIALITRRNKRSPSVANKRLPSMPTADTMPKHGPASAASRARMIAMLEMRKPD